MNTAAFKIAVLAGLACIVVGVWCIYWPAGVIALGAALLVAGIGSS